MCVCVCTHVLPLLVRMAVAGRFLVCVSVLLLFVRVTGGRLLFVCVCVRVLLLPVHIHNHCHIEINYLLKIGTYYVFTKIISTSVPFFLFFFLCV